MKPNVKSNRKQARVERIKNKYDTLFPSVILFLLGCESETAALVAQFIMVILKTKIADLDSAYINRMLRAFPELESVVDYRRAHPTRRGKASVEVNWQTAQELSSSIVGQQIQVGGKTLTVLKPEVSFCCVDENGKRQKVAMSSIMAAMDKKAEASKEEKPNAEQLLQKAEMESRAKRKAMEPEMIDVGHKTADSLLGLGSKTFDHEQAIVQAAQAPAIKPATGLPIEEAEAKDAFDKWYAETDSEKVYKKLRSLLTECCSDPESLGYDQEEWSEMGSEERSEAMLPEIIGNMEYVDIWEEVRPKQAQKTTKKAA